MLVGVACAAEPVTNGAPGPTVPAQQSSDQSAGIPPGTVITKANWENFRQFMSDGLAALFEGKYPWKMPNDAQMEAGLTVIDPLPKNYLVATEQFGSQVKLVALPEGGWRLQGYRGGVPFPNPQEPDRGEKVLMNLWYRYMPELVVTHGWDCALDPSGNSNCQTYQVVNRQLSYNTDATASPPAPASDAKYFTEWFMVLEPEQSRYTASLTINYVDMTRPEEVYTFIPSLRRYQQMATSGRCAGFEGQDWTTEDFRSGLDSPITELQARYVAHKRIMALTGLKAPDNPFPDGFFMSLGWPKPSWAKWQVRDVDVISVQKIPSKAAGYCYGKRVMYVDSHSSSALWEELYDSKMQPWKLQMVVPQRIDVPGTGPALTPGVDVEFMWDLQRQHATFAGESIGTVYVDHQAPAEFQDVPRYSTPAGLNLIMR